MERFAPLGKSCAPFARGDWNAALEYITSTKPLHLYIIVMMLVSEVNTRQKEENVSEVKGCAIL